MTGHDQAKAVADKIKEDAEAKKAQDVQETAVVKNQLEMVRNNPELAKMYSDNAKVGAENLGGDLPVLKVHTTGRSSTNELPDGSEPEDGHFFYVPKQIQIKEPIIHPLTISRGYYAEGINIDSATGKKKMIWNQIVGGIITNDDLNYPFITYVTGKRLQPMWDFGKALGKYTRAKPVGIPMFAMLVKMSNTKEVNPYGKSWITHYDILLQDDGSPKLVTDPGEFQFLRDMVDVIKETTEKIIAAKAVEEPEKLRSVEATPVQHTNVDVAPADPDADAMPF